jgi:hypothetical protein
LWRHCGHGPPPASTPAPLFRSIRNGGKVAERLTTQAVAGIIGFLHRQRSVAPRFKMMDVSRHRSADTLRGYFRDASCSA